MQGFEQESKDSLTNPITYLQTHFEAKASKMTKNQHKKLQQLERRRKIEEMKELEKAFIKKQRKNVKNY